MLDEPQDALILSAYACDEDGIRARQARRPGLGGRFRASGGGEIGGEIFQVGRPWHVVQRSIRPQSVSAAVQLHQAAFLQHERRGRQTGELMNIEDRQWFSQSLKSALDQVVEIGRQHHGHAQNFRQHRQHLMREARLPPFREMEEKGVDHCSIFRRDLVQRAHRLPGFADTAHLDPRQEIQGHPPIRRGTSEEIARVLLDRQIPPAVALTRLLLPGARGQFAQHPLRIERLFSRHSEPSIQLRQPDRERAFLARSRRPFVDDRGAGPRIDPRIPQVVDIGFAPRESRT